MRHSFLIGRFLPAYASVYRYNRKPPQAQTPHLNRNTLKRRFAEREHRFRAAQRKYGFTLQACTAVALLLVITAFSVDFRPRKSVSLEMPTQELVTINDIVQTRQEIKPPPPPRPPVPVEVPDDEILEEDDLNLDASLDIDTPLADLPPPPPVEEEVEEEELDFFEIVEEMPSMIGGLKALSADLSYPMLAQRAGIEGTVIVRILIDESGVPGTPFILKSVHELLDNAAVTAVLKQRFAPGRQRGRAVRVQMAIPVRFRLKDSL